ncbi:MAG TPA: hypothetical protein VGK73_24650 [Polyangiaceae bacterium]
MPLPIVIDVGVTDPPRELTTVLVEACTRAATETTCHLVRDAPEGPYAAIAIVTWEAEDRVRIEVGLRRETGAEWRSRQISFQQADVVVERYRSVGFVIGTVATAPPEEPPPAPPAPEPPPAPPPVPVVPLKPPRATPKPPPPPPSRGFVGLAGLIGRGLDEGGPRYGGNLRAGIRVIDRVAVLLSASASVRPRDDQGLALAWMDAGLGLGVAVGAPTRSHLELRLEMLGEHFSADLEDGDRSAERARTIPAARVGVDGVWMIDHFLGVVVGVEGVLRYSKTQVDAFSGDAGNTLVFEPCAILGARLEL